MKTSNSILRPFLFAMVLGTVFISGCKGGKEAETDDKAKSEQSADGKDGKKDEKKADAVPVEVAAVTKRQIAATYSGTANLEAPGESQVVAKTSGVMIQLLAEEGDVVHKGQVLARLDGDKARLQAAGAAATVHKLENNYRRSQQLREQKLVSAESNDQLRYELESARSTLDLAKLELSYTQITAPISGVIAQRMVKPGNLVNLNAPVFRIVDNSHLEAVLSVPERQMATLKIGMPLRMIVDAVPGTVFEGKVDRVSPVVDTTSGTFRVVCAFAGSNTLRPGMFGRIEIVYDQRDGVLTLPRTALIEDEGESAVYIVRDKKAVRVPVQLGYVDGEVVEVRSGVKENENVITAGKVAVRDGTEVEVIKAAGSTAVAADSKSPAVK